MLTSGVAVHVGGHYFADFDGLHHVGGDEVELYVARVTLGGRYAVAVDGDGAEVGAGASHLSEACLALVVLYVDARDAFQGVADVGVRELAHLVGRDDVADAHGVFLRAEGASLSGEGAAHDDFLQFDAFVQGDVAFDGFPFGDGNGKFGGRVAYVGDFYPVGAGCEVGQGVEAVYVADGACVERFDVDGGSRQGLLGIVDDASADGALFGFVHVLIGQHR